jgi:hypothetical protein
MEEVIVFPPLHPARQQLLDRDEGVRTFAIGRQHRTTESPLTEDANHFVSTFEELRHAAIVPHAPDSWEPSFPVGIGWGL